MPIKNYFVCMKLNTFENNHLPHSLSIIHLMRILKDIHFKQDLVGN